MIGLSDLCTCVCVCVCVLYIVLCLAHLFSPRRLHRSRSFSLRHSAETPSGVFASEEELSKSARHAPADKLSRLFSDVETNNRWRHVVHIRDLPRGCTEEDIIAAFSGCGDVASVSLYGMDEDMIDEFKKEADRLQKRSDRARRNDRRTRKNTGKEIPSRKDVVAFGSHAFVQFASAEGKAAALSPNIRVLGIQVSGMAGRSDGDRRRPVAATMVNPRDSESLTTLCISHSSLGKGISGRDMAKELNRALHRGGLEIDVGEDVEFTSGSSPSISAPAAPSPVASFGKCYIDFSNHADARKAFDCLQGVEVVMEDGAGSRGRGLSRPLHVNFVYSDELRKRVRKSERELYGASSPWSED